MTQRLIIALLGASLVTIALMYGMSAIAEYFNRPDSQVYLRVMDVIPGSGERRRPTVTRPQAQPDRAAIDAADSTPIGADSDAALGPAVETLRPAIETRLNLDRNQVETPTSAE